MQSREDTRSRSPFRRPPARDPSPPPAVVRADGGAADTQQRPAFRTGWAVLICVHMKLLSCSLAAGSESQLVSFLQLLTDELFLQRLMNGLGDISSWLDPCSPAAVCWGPMRTLP